MRWRKVTSFISADGDVLYDVSVSISVSQLAKEMTSTTKKTFMFYWCETFILKDMHESVWHFCQMQFK